MNQQAQFSWRKAWYHPEDVCMLIHRISGKTIERLCYREVYPVPGKNAASIA
jgi:hypothetical protein